MWARSFATILLVLLLTPHSSSARRNRRASPSVLSSAAADRQKPLLEQPLEKLKGLVASVKTDDKDVQGLLQKVSNLIEEERSLEFLESGVDGLVLAHMHLELKKAPLSTEGLTGSERDETADGAVALHISEILGPKVARAREILDDVLKRATDVEARLGSLPADVQRTAKELVAALKTMNEDKWQPQLKNADIVVKYVEWVKVSHFEVQLAFVEPQGDASPKFYATNFIADLTVNVKYTVWDRFPTWSKIHHSIRIGVELTEKARIAAEAAASSGSHKEFIPGDFELKLSGIINKKLSAEVVRRKGPMIKQAVADSCNAAVSLPAAEATVGDTVKGQLSRVKAVKIQVQTGEKDKIAIYAAAQVDEKKEFSVPTDEQADALKKMAFKALSSLVNVFAQADTEL